MCIRDRGFTESTVDGGFSRLKACDIDKFFNRVYMSENPNIENVYSIDNKCTVLKNICKPDPELDVYKRQA